jgi:hypothetical protein
MGRLLIEAANAPLPQVITVPKATSVVPTVAIEEKHFMTLNLVIIVG